MLYIAYPTALVLISIALWVVMIGIIKLTGRCNFAILRDNATLNRFFSLHVSLGDRSESNPPLSTQ